MAGPRWLQDVRASRLRSSLTSRPVPAHVGLIMDGNRRWARYAGYADPSVGHRFGADHLQVVLGWCHEAGIDCVTAYVVSLSNLRKRSTAEVRGLFELIESVLPRALSDPASPWSVHVVGALEILPLSTRAALEECVRATRDRPADVTLGIGYDPHHDIANAFRAWTADQAAAGLTPAAAAERATVETLARHFATSTRPDIDVIIRTGGEQRVSGFFPWQSTHADLYVCDAHWPGFAELDFLRVLRAWADRHVGTPG